MSDFRTPTRAAIMAALKASPDVTSLIPQSSVYPGTVPAQRTFPFSRFGSIIGTPFRATGLVSSKFRLTVQGFTKATLSAGGGILVTAEDNAAAIGSAFESALDLATLPVTIDGVAYKVRLGWVQTITMIDGDDNDAWMVTSIFNAEVAG